MSRDLGGETDPDTGEYTPDVDVLYEGPADVQDEGAFVSMRAQIPERIAGQGDATALLPEEADYKLKLMKPGDFVAVEWDPSTLPVPPAVADDAWWEARDAATIVRVVLLGSKLILKGIE